MKINRICSLVFATVFFAAAALFVFSPLQVHAADQDDYFWIDVLQYGGIRQPGQTYGSTTTFVTNKDNRAFPLALPYMLSYQYVDMVIYTGGGYPPTDLKFRVEDDYLNVVKWGQYGEYWRCYGEVSLRWGQENAVILYVETSYEANLYMNVMSCRIADTIPYSDISATWSIYQDSTQIVTSNFPTYNAHDWRGYDEPGNLRIEIPYAQWLKYEHIDIMMLLDVSHIDGITACLVNDNGFIPVRTQYLYNGEQEESFNMLSLSFDLTNVKASTSNLRVYITFHTTDPSSNNFILYSIHGWRTTQFVQGEAFWFPKLIQAIKDSFSSMYQPPAGASPPQISDSMQAGQDFVQDGIGQVDQELDVIATIPRPDLGSIDLPSDHLDSIDYNTNVAHLTMLTHSQPFRLIFFFAALFMVVGVVVYGRRG